MVWSARPGIAFVYTRLEALADRWEPASILLIMENPLSAAPGSAMGCVLLSLSHKKHA